jgi:probable UDP-sugar transporter A4
MDRISRYVYWGLLLAVQTVTYGSYTILVHLSESSTGHIAYSSASMNLTIEVIKLVFSIIGYSLHFCSYNDPDSQDQNSVKSLQIQETFRFSFKTSIYFVIPGFLYFLNNNLAVHIQFHMDSASYQILSNFKIFTTAVLYYFIIGKHLSGRKWFSLVLLFSSSVFYVVGNLRTKQENPTESFDVFGQMHIETIGLFMIIIYTFISGLSGVYSEYLLKLNYSNSIFLQSIYLYLYGTLFNVFVIFGESFSNDNQFRIFHGFNLYTWIIIFTQAFNGLAMSFVMKFSNNFTRLFVISFSLVITASLSVIIFGLLLNFYFYTSFLIMFISIYLYTK